MILDLTFFHFSLQLCQRPSNIFSCSYGLSSELNLRYTNEEEVRAAVPLSDISVRSKVSITNADKIQLSFISPTPTHLTCKPCFTVTLRVLQ